MKTYDIKSDMPDVLEASKRLVQIIKEAKKTEKVIKIIHGYGSSGVGGKIKSAVHKSLRNRLNSKEIKAYIPGEAFSLMMGFDEVIHKYSNLLKNDSDFKKGNDGITYIIF
jgi:cobalamin biosynthesis protein CbiD